MPTLVILGFVLMLLLPCAIALLGARRDDTAEAAEDVSAAPPAVRTHRAEEMLADAMTAAYEEKARREAERRNAEAERRKAEAAFDPPAPGWTLGSRPQNKLHLELDEIAALQMRALAMRSNAEALEALARAAMARAEAAMAEAEAAEHEAAEAIREVRRAA